MDSESNAILDSVVELENILTDMSDYLYDRYSDFFDQFYLGDSFEDVQKKPG